METTRSPLGSLLEWLIAAAVIGTLVIAALVIVHQIQQLRGATPVIAGEAAPPEPPAGVPPRTISVPMLLLADGKELRVGTPMSDLAAILGHAAQVGDDLVERGTARARITRFYNYLGARFVVVFEPADPAKARVAAIYLE